MLRFPFGAIRITPGAEAALTVEEATALMRRHLTGDWGDMDAEDKAANNRSVDGGGRLMSQYRLSGDRVIWIVTEWDRSATTLLLPDEY